MDGLSTLASLIAVAQISGSIVSLCYEYRNGLQTSSKDMNLLVTEVKSLRDVLENLIGLVDQDQPTEKLLESVKKLTQSNGIVDECKAVLQSLETKLRPKDGWRRLGQQLMWPFKEQDVMKSVASIERFKATLSLAISMDHTALSITILGTAMEIRSKTEGLTQQFNSLKLQKEIRTVESWLVAPDPSANFRATLEKRHPGTGLWFTNSRKYTEWKQTPGTLLFLHGIQGCGKSVLSACVIDDLFISRGRNSNVTLAYFYFDLNDQSKRSSDNVLRSVILQLSRQSRVAFDSLQKLHQKSTDYWHVQRELDSPQISRETLLHTLQSIISKLDHTYLVLDGLDESCDRQSNLADVIAIMNSAPSRVSVLVTSRDESDVDDYLSAWKIQIDGAEVDNDIRIYIQQSLSQDPGLTKWSENLREEIQKTLMSGAQGMFRWVECQLAMIRKCVKPQAVKRALNSLPKSLEGSYRAILDSIDEAYVEDAHTILQWMVCCRSPLLLAEIAEVLAFDSEDRLSFDPDFRVPYPKDVLKICSSLVAISPSDPATGSREVRLAHSTVREFLVTETTSMNGPGSFLVVEELAHKMIAEMCLTYLLYLGGHGTTDTEYTAIFPLAAYAARNWVDHYKTAGYPEDTSSLATSLFTSPEDAFAAWRRVVDIDKPWSSYDRYVDKSAGPLYYASLAGLHSVVHSLLQAGADPNQKGGVFGTPIQAVAFRRDVDLVETLLSHGADPNRSGGRFLYPLMAAASRGYYDIAKILISNGASPECKEFSAGHALLVASRNGHQDIVQLLLDSGADINASTGKVGTALHAAASKGHESICKLLVARGAKVEDHSWYTSNAIRSAAMNGNEDLTLYLMDQGVQPSPNILSAAVRGGLENLTKKLLDQGIEVTGHPFQDAAYGGHIGVVRLMLEHGYDINAQEDYCGTALHAAAIGGHIALMQELLGHEPPAKVTARGSLQSNGSYYGSVLETGVLSGRVDVVEFLIERGADVRFQEDFYGSALQLAASKGDTAIFKVLLAHGADINAHLGHLGSSLQAAAAADNLEIVEELLSLQCDVNHFLGRGYHDTAIEAAASVGNAEIIRLLLARGAKTTMEVTEGFYNGPVVTAADKGYLPIVKQLFNAGADVDAKCCRRFASPLELAVRSGHTDVVKFLLAHGADVNQECLFKDVLRGHLYAGSKTRDGGVSIARLLMDYGADPNRHFTHHSFHQWYRDSDMFPLLLAVWESLDNLVEALLSGGANVNEQNIDGWAAIHNIMFRSNSEGNAKLCRLLIETWKADIGLRLTNGSTALHLAAQKGRIDCMNIILDAGFDINDRNSLGQTALHTATEYRQSHIVQVLLERGADLSVKDEKGQMTALDIAEFNLSQRQKEHDSDDSDYFDGSSQSDDGEEVVELLRATDKQKRNQSDFHGLS